MHVLVSAALTDCLFVVQSLSITFCHSTLFGLLCSLAHAGIESVSYKGRRVSSIVPGLLSSWSSDIKTGKTNKPIHWKDKKRRNYWKKKEPIGKKQVIAHPIPSPPLSAIRPVKLSSLTGKVSIEQNLRYL